MKVVDKIEENPISELSEQNTENLFRSIVMGKDVTEDISTDKGIFTVKFPRMKDIESIGRLTAYRLNGIPAHCFDADTYDMMQRIATLDVITVKGPAWYELAKKNQPNFSWQEIPTIDLINEVYAKAYQFRLAVQKEINGNKETANRKMDNIQNSEKDIEPGLFDELSGTARSDG